MFSGILPQTGPDLAQKRKTTPVDVRVLDVTRREKWNAKI
jgi:hypothetical protein